MSHFYFHTGVTVILLELEQGRGQTYTPEQSSLPQTCMVKQLEIRGLACKKATKFEKRNKTELKENKPKPQNQNRDNMILYSLQ